MNNLALAEHTEFKADRRKQRVTYRTSLDKWSSRTGIGKNGGKEPKSYKDKKQWRTMITHVLKGYGIFFSGDPDILFFFRFLFIRFVFKIGGE